MSVGIKELAKITSARLELSDRRFATLVIAFDYGGSGQSFAPVLCDWCPERKRRIGTAAGLDMVMQILRLFKEETLERLKGRVCYVLRDRDGLSGSIVGIEMPAFEGGESFLMSKWREEWGYEVQQ